MRDVGMVIHVVARKIGEAAGGDAHAIEAGTVEPVREASKARCVTALARDFVELLMQRDRIRRRQASRRPCASATPADGANARGLMPEPLPIWRAKAATEVLPLVPVTAAMVAAAAEKILPQPAPARGADLA